MISVGDRVKIGHETRVVVRIDVAMGYDAADVHPQSIDCMPPFRCAIVWRHAGSDRLQRSWDFEWIAWRYQIENQDNQGLPQEAAA